MKIDKRHLYDLLDQLSDKRKYYCDNERIDGYLYNAMCAIWDAMSAADELNEQED